ncbi:MAG: NAD-dependent epimerase/dehydratase [Proteobacteria bacterium]|nr:NAD-dependent epimerase/dehydratase [Pseudomonadota bacterium]
MSSKKVALVVGASGIIGNALVERLAASPDWDVRALRQTGVPGVATIDVDLHDAAATVAALRGADDSTHVFYAAFAPQLDLAVEESVNLAMLRHLLDGLKAAGAPLQRIVLYQGAKVYGVHLGRVQAPFYEDDPRHLGPNFYYAQEDLLRARAERDGFDWSILRPDVVVGSAAGKPMNIAVVIGVFAALSKARGVPLRFPGTLRAYREVLAQATDAGWLAQASLWAALAPASRNEVFNIVGEPFRWERIWQHVADALGMAVAPPQPMSLARQMPSQAARWAELAARSGLRPLPFERIVGWDFGDFIFNSEFDVISDMGKIRRAGFVEPSDNEQWFRTALAELQRKKVIP